MNMHAESENNENLADIFCYQAKKHTDRVAISFDGHDVTYGELNDQSNRIAHLLDQMDIGVGQVVVILMDRSIDA